ncbi:MAG: hypothetical protein ABI954_12330 [Pyrinomonadaceae bacterium]
MNSKIWLTVGFLVIPVSFVAAVYYANQIMNEVIKAQTEGTPEPNLDVNAAALSSIFVSIGFIFVIIGLIKRKKEKKAVNQ